MADLGAVGISSDGGTYLVTTASMGGRATAVQPTPRPAPQGGLVIVTSSGGMRG